MIAIPLVTFWIGGDTISTASSAAAAASLRAIGSAAVSAARGPGLRALGWMAEKAFEEGGQFTVNAGLKVGAKLAAKFVIVPIAHEVQTVLDSPASVPRAQRQAPYGPNARAQALSYGQPAFHGR